MTEGDTQMYYTWDGNSIRYASARNGASVHREAGNSGGWYVDYQNAYYTNGCAGCDHISVNGNLGFGYRGLFDETGTVYYNTFHNYITGYRNGAWNCNYSVSWRNSAPGWHMQQWCSANP